MANEPNRQCLECGQLLPLTDFRKNNKSLAGYTRRCKPCLLALDNARWAAMPEGEAEAKLAARREQRAQHRRDNPEKIKAQKAAHFQRHREKCLERTRANRLANPERLRQLARGWQNTRRSRKAGGITAKQQADWEAAQAKVCYWCGCRCAKAYHVDHYTPLATGGKHEIDNLVIACVPCNLKKNAKDPLDFAQEVGRLL